MAIVFNINTEQVSEVIKCIRKHNYIGPLSVRSGGHDHEGECSSTDAPVIDLSKMTRVDIEAELEQRADLYCKETRWKNHPYWLRRHDEQKSAVAKNGMSIKEQRVCS
jgi:hypothetical protein